MARIEHGSGVWLDFDDQAFRVETPRATRGARTGSFDAFDETPVLLDAAASPGSGPAQRLADRLVAGGVAQRASAPIPLGPGPGAPTGDKRALPPQQPTRLTVELGDGEDAVVLVEGDGVLAWRYGRPADAAGGRRGAGATQRARIFDLGLPPIAASDPVSAPDARRGWLRDRLVDGVKAIVLYFAAEAAVAGAVYLLERKRRDGPVVITSATDPSLWQKPADFSDLVLPRDRPVRLLLLVHGTFSSTVGGFGELCVTPWGQRLLGTALTRYDAVIGFDHRTLAKSPLDNAGELLAALKTLPAAQPVEVDAVCHSRGGLVLRTLTERLLPGAGPALRVRRAVFVAATNRGTELARPENWESLIDLVTNLSAATATVLSLFPAAAVAAQIVDEAIDAIGDFVRYLVGVAVEQRRVPGIAAMDPAGDFVRELNLTQPGQPGPADIDCYAIVSDFYAKLLDDGEHEPKELPKRLAFILADGVVDRLMRGAGGERIANDLVVDVASMTEIDRAVGGFVKDVLDFGRNPLVYHTNYFLRPETAGRLALWLRLPSPLEDVDALLVAGAERRFARLPADANLAEARALIESDKPSFLVIERPDPADAARRLYYAVKPFELLDITSGAAAEASVIDAFDLHEFDQSSDYDGDALPFDSATAAPPRGTRPHARRGIVFDGGRPSAVLDEHFGAADAATLAALARGLALPRAIDDPAPMSPPEYEPELFDDLLDKPFGGGGSTRYYRVDDDEDYNADDGESPRHGGRRGGARGTPAAVEPPAPRPSEPAPRTDTFASAEMARETRLGAEALVSVTLSAEQVEASAGLASAQGRFAMQPGRLITVQVIPRCGYVHAPGDAGLGRAEVDPPRVGAPVTLDFALLASEVGPGEVTVAIRQGALRLLTLTLRSTVVEATAAATRPGLAASSAALAPGADCGLCPTLEIFDQRGRGKLGFMYVLRAGETDERVDDRFWSEAIEIDPKDYVDARYAEIEKAWLGSERALARFAERLEAIGGSMFRRLFPRPLQQALWRLARLGQLADILVYSDEPFVPWEVVFLDDPDAPAASGQGRFFGELGLCRWLPGAPLTCSIEVRAGMARHVIPTYPDPALQLAWAGGAERQMLEAELGARALAPRHDAIVELLQRPGSFDLLHFACHGKADSQDIDSAALLLEGELLHTARGRTWGKESLLASTVDQVADLRRADGKRPLVVVNACQTGRLGYALTGLGGFATAFLGTRAGTGSAKGRAGAFVGALWSVGDQAASHFVIALYRELKQGRTIAQASRAARGAARAAGEGSWLAYAVYAHPHLRVRFS